MAEPSKPTSAERLWLILGSITVVMLVTSLCLIALGESGNWLTPVGMLFTGASAFGGFIFERRKRRRGVARPTDDAGPVAPK